MTNQTPDALAALRERAKADGGFTDYSCPECGDIFWGGFCQCPDNTYRCEKCGHDESRCGCYPWLDDHAIESARSAIAFAQCPPWDGLSLTAERVHLSKLLGYPKAADEIMAQVRAWGHPGPRKKYTEADRIKTRAWLEANCTPAELAELDQPPGPQELARIEAETQAAHAVLAQSRFGDCRWSDQVWAYIDILLGADKKSIALAEAARKARQEAKAKEYDEFNRKFEERFNEQSGEK